MKVRLQFLLCGVVAICAVAGSESTKAEPEKAPPVADATPEKPEVKLGKWDGFRGVAWLDPLDKEKGFGYGIATDDGTMAYMRADDKMSIGSANLDRIAYHFYEDKLVMVGMHVVGSDNVATMIDALEAQYGKPSEKDMFLEDRTWNGTSTSGDPVLVIFKSDFGKEKADVYIAHIPSVSAISEAKKKKNAEQAKKDF